MSSGVERPPTPLSFKNAKYKLDRTNVVENTEHYLEKPFVQRKKIKPLHIFIGLIKQKFTVPEGLKSITF